MVKGLEISGGIICPALIHMQGWRKWASSNAVRCHCPAETSILPKSEERGGGGGLGHMSHFHHP